MFKGREFESIYWMDIFSHIFSVKMSILFEKTENKQKKRPGLAHLLNKINSLSL